jgi:serine phosphatase RsbU (regulator of sigma subunit)
MSASTSFWQSSTRGSSVLFLLGVFLIFATFAFAGDQAELGSGPVLRLAINILVVGTFAVAYAVSGFTLRGQFWKAFFPLFALEVLLMGALVHWFPGQPQPTQIDAAGIARLQRRLAWDSYAIEAAILLGYTCFVYVTITQGRRYFRVRAEIDLAMEIHRVLVPAIDQKIGGYEFYGRSSPSGDVGGDLIDLASQNHSPDHSLGQSDNSWVAYVADVSGHGVAPGVMMSMVKSAARMLLSSGASSDRLLPRLNEVLYPLKKPEMFATFCFLASNREAKNGDGLRIGLAGHPAILHLSGRTNEVTQLECQNLPLAILPSADFVTSEVLGGPGDVFVLYTDGLPETENAAGEEYGIPRLIEELQKHGKEPLPAISQAIQQSVAAYGKQVDDQSLFLIRRLWVSPPPSELSLRA